MFYFIFVLLCFIISLCTASSSRDSRLLRLAMLFTVTADFFMILFQMNYAGLFFFCIVQFVYIIRYSNIKRALTALSIALGICICLSIFTSLPLLDEMACGYAVLLVFSVVSSFTALKEQKYPLFAGIMICVGMVLFLLCDVNVALFNIFANTPLEGYFSTAIWIFYLPSQLILCFGTFSPFLRLYKKTRKD